MSHNPSEIIQIFGAQETFLIIIFVLLNISVAIEMHLDFLLVIFDEKYV